VNHGGLEDLGIGHTIMRKTITMKDLMDIRLLEGSVSRVVRAVHVHM
jgi:hypothetical protein